MINKIYIVNGPNLNLLGQRNPSLYGSVSFETYFETLKNKYPELTLEYFQSNHEGAIIDYLQTHGFEETSGIILNAGGYSHTSIAIRDAVEAIMVPVMEVHITDIYSRESFRHHSFLTDVCSGQFVGKGLEGYDLAIGYLTLHE